MRTRRRQERDGADRRHGTAATEARKADSSAVSAATLRTRSGNAGLQTLIGRMSAESETPLAPAKLAISHPGDSHEREADRVADAVMRSPIGAPALQRLCAGCDDGILRAQRQPDPAAPAPTDTRPDPVDTLVDAIALAIEEPLSAITLETPEEPQARPHPAARAQAALATDPQMDHRPRHEECAARAFRIRHARHGRNHRSAARAAQG